MSENTGPLDIREKSQLLPCRLSHGLLFLSHLPQRRCARGPVYIASFWQLTEPFQCQLPTRWIMISGLLGGPSTTWIQMPSGHKGNKCQPMGQQRTKDLLSFLTGAEIRNLETVILIKAGVLRLHVASETVKECGHPLPKPEKWVNTQPLYVVTTTPQGGTQVSFSPQLSPFNVRDSNKRRHATVLRRGEGLWKL